MPLHPIGLREAVQKVVDAFTENADAGFPMVNPECSEFGFRAARGSLTRQDCIARGDIDGSVITKNPWESALGPMYKGPETSLTYRIRRLRLDAVLPQVMARIEYAEEREMEAVLGALEALGMRRSK